MLCNGCPILGLAALLDLIRCGFFGAARYGAGFAPAGTAYTVLTFFANQRHLDVIQIAAPTMKLSGSIVIRPADPVAFTDE